MLRGRHASVLMRGGESPSGGKSEWGLGVVGTQGEVVVAEAVVRPPGFRVLVVASKQQGTGAPITSGAFAVQRLGCVPLYGSGGGVNQFLWRTRQVTSQGILKVEFRAKPGNMPQAISVDCPFCFLPQQLSDFDLWGDVTTLRTLVLLAIAHKA